ncbi:MAG: hypothetical protein KME30_19045 [Iphinoe sp. HA4291-MV1]|jgi:hypothetical protein|nr:hypothetical protein [Iphinoe sp. HA4291-MV1]
MYAETYKDPRIGVKQLWRQMRQSGEVSVTYQAFLKWVKNPLKINNTRYGLCLQEVEAVKAYAAIRRASIGRTAYKGFNKAQVTQALQEAKDVNQEVSGAQLLEICDLYDARTYALTIKTKSA